MSAARKFLQFSLLFMGLIALVMVSAIITMKAITWSKTVSVPDVRNKDLTVAINDIRNSGLDIRIDRQEHSPTVPAHNVISQSPPAGSNVKTGRNVLVVVSLGSEEVAVPDLVGGAFRQAQVRLKQAGLVLGEVARAYSQTAPGETVLGQEPPPQSSIQKGMPEDLLVSGGPMPVKFVSPELVGRTPAEAAEVVRPMSLKIDAKGSGKIIISQEPKAGFPVTAGDQISVVLGEPPAAPAKKEKGRV